MEGSIPNFSEKRVAVVTGGNKGMGLEICRQLASNGIVVILTARDEKRGMEAVEKLRGLGLSDIVFHQLEITEPSSAARLAHFVQARLGKLDILVNNAAIIGVTTEIDTSTPLEEVFEGKDVNERAEWLRQRSAETYEKAQECLNTNYFGTKHVTEALIPLLESSSSGRIVNLSSVFGLLRNFSSEELKQELNDIDNLTEKRVDELSDLFLKDLKDGHLESLGWPVDGYSAYKVSKALVNAYSRILAKKYPALRINCVHPGYVKTDMNMHTGDLTVEEGASAPVMVALLPDGGPTGTYFNRTQVASFV